MFKIGDICETKEYEHLYSLCDDGIFRIEIHDGFEFVQHVFMLLEMPKNYRDRFMFDYIDLPPEGAYNDEMCSVKILIKEQVRYLILPDDKLEKYIRHLDKI